MKTISLIHIADIHYSHIIRKCRSIDGKTGFPPNLLKYFGSPEYQKITDLLRKNSSDVESILFSGDITSEGNIEAYREWLKYFKELIDKKILDIPSAKIIFVPGNHDLSREKADPNEIDKKFEDFNSALRQYEFGNYPSDQIQTHYLGRETGCKISLIAINSCLGCGEKIHFHELIQKLITSDPQILESYYTIDTPLINSEIIDQLYDAINDDEKTIPILLTHHNLLTSKKTRIAIYGELINSGQIRKKLHSLNRPLIYIHGHIHSSQIEIIQNLENDKSKLICISTPPLYPIEGDDGTEFGFNKIFIHFTEEGFPLGCTIRSFYYSNDELKQSEKSVRFVNINDVKNNLDLEDEKVIQSILSIQQSEFFISDISGAYCKKHEIPLENIEEINLKIEQIVEKLCWLGYLSYRKNYFEKNKTNIGQRKVKKVLL